MGTAYQGYLNKTFGLHEGLSRPCFVVKSLTEPPAMPGPHASPGHEIPLARFQKHLWDSH